MEESEEKGTTEDVPAETDVEVPETAHEEEKYDGLLPLLRARSHEIIASVSATCGAFALGAVIGWSSPATPKLSLTSEEVSWIGSIMTIGAVVTTFHTAYFLERLGRRATILIQVVPFTIGWLLITFGTSHVAMLYTGRFFLGLASGSMCMAAPTYISEISSPDVRGGLATLFQLMLTMGILYVYVLGAFASVMVLSLASLVWPFITFGALWFLPESPFFLSKRGKKEAAEKSINWFHPGADIGKEMDNIGRAAELKDEPLLTVLKSKSASWAAYTIFGLMLLQQLSGINVVMFYSVDVFDRANTVLSGNNAAIVLGVVQVVVTAVAAAIVDKTGRRVLLIISFAGMTVCQLFLGFYFAKVIKANWLPLVAINMYLVFFSVGAGPLPWTMLGELLPPGAKGAVSSVAVLLNWGSAFVVTKTFHGISDAFGESTSFWIYGVCCAIAVVVIFFCVPETKGKTLAEIQKGFGG